MKTVNHIFGLRLQDAMQTANCTPIELSEMCGVNKSTIYRYINNQTMPSPSTIVKISQVLNCSIDWLLGMG